MFKSQELLSFLSFLSLIFYNWIILSKNKAINTEKALDNQFKKVYKFK